MNDNEQWKHDGDCTKCRRQKYCSKECGASRNATERYVSGLVVKYITDTIVKGSTKWED